MPLPTPNRHAHRLTPSLLALLAAGCLFSPPPFALGLSIDDQLRDPRSASSSVLDQSQASPRDVLAANLSLAEYSLKQGAWPETARYAHAVLAKEKDNSKAHAILGLIAALGGQRQQAEEHLVFLQGKKETGVYPELIAAVLNGQQKNYVKAQEQLNAALKKEPEHPVALYYSGSLHLAQEQLDQAEQAFAAALRHAPDLAAAHAGLGQVYWQKKQMEKAAASYQKAIAIEPDTLLYHQQLIAVYKDAGQKEAADKASRDMLYFVPGVKERSLEQGLELVNRGSYDEAIKLADRLLAVYKKFPAGHYIKAVALINKGDGEAARKSIADLIAAGTRIAKTHHEAGLCYLVLGDLGKAEEQFKLVISLDPDNSRSFVFLPIIEQLRGHRDRALNGLSVMLAQKESPALIHYLQANNYLADGKTAEYTQEMEEGKTLVPGLQKATLDFPAIAKDSVALSEHRNLMVLLYFNGWYEQSVQKSGAVLKTLPSDPFALWYHGLAKMAQKRYPDAILSFKKLLQLEPNLVAAQMELGQAYALSGDRQNALATFRKVTAMAPSHAPAYSAMGDLYYQSGQDAAAVQSYRKAIEINPKAVQSYPPLAILLAEQPEQSTEALKFAEKAVEHAPRDPASLDALGWVYVQQGQYKIGIEKLHAALNLLPQDPLAMYHLGVGYYKNNQPEQAHQWLQAALGVTKDFRGSGQAQEILNKISRQ